MNTKISNAKAPLKGLLVYLLYSVSGSLITVFLLSLILVLALLFTGNQLVYTLFSGIGIIGPPYVVLMSMGGGKYGKWERFQLTMPIKRSDLVKSQYLNMFLASLVGIPLVALVTGISFNIHATLFDYSLLTAYINITALIAVPLFMVGILFPLSCTKFGEDKQDGLTLVCFLISVALPTLITIAGGRSGLSEGIPSLLAFVLSIIVFTISYIITKNIYAKIDF